MEEGKKTLKAGAIHNRRKLALVISIAALLVAVTILILRPLYAFADCKIDGNLAFVTHGDIYTTNADKTDLRQLTKLNFTPLAPAWSFDGKQIVFSANQTSDARNIFVMNANGTDVHRVTNYAYPYSADDPTWSPDGKKIVFSLYWISAENLQKWRSYMATRTMTPNADKIGTPIPPQTNSEIFSMNADGTSQQNLTRSANAEFSPHWSPDGTHIILASTSDAFNRQTSKLYIMNTDGSGLRLLADLYAAAPKWSPDGRYIVFARRLLIGNSWGSGISIVNADGTGLRDLVEDATDDFRHPAWSSDGKNIAFQVWYGDNPEIHIIDFEGKHRCRLIAGDRSFTDFPSWKPQ